MDYIAYVDFLPDGSVVLYDKFLEDAEQKRFEVDDNFKYVDYGDDFIISIPNSSVRVFKGYGNFNRQTVIDYLRWLGISENLIKIYGDRRAGR